MYKSKSFFMIFMIIAVMSAVTACSSDSAGTATVTINTGLGMDKAVTKAPAPSNVASISVIVTGADGTELIRQTFGADGTALDGNAGSAAEYSAEGIITLTLSPGPDITFTIVATGNGGIAEWTGSATMTIAAGETVVIPVAMAVSSERIIVPDQVSSRIVQIDNMSGEGWVEKIGPEIGYDVDPIDLFRPFDVDVDSIGRIYISNFTSSPNADILRIDNINDASCEIIASMSTMVMALDIDRSNNYLYFTLADNTLWRKNLATQDPPVNMNLQSAEINASNPLTGIAVDGNYIYIVARYYPGVFKLDMRLSEGSRQVAVYQEPAADYSFDVIVKNQYVYICSTAFNFPNADDKIVRLDQGLKLDNELGGFNSPIRFLATLNRRIYFIDADDDSPSDTERIMSISDIDDDAWEQFNPSMIGQSAFMFYSSC